MRNRRFPPLLSVSTVPVCASFRSLCPPRHAGAGYNRSVNSLSSDVRYTTLNIGLYLLGQIVQPFPLMRKYCCAGGSVIKPDNQSSMKPPINRGVVDTLSVVEFQQVAGFQCLELLRCQHDVTLNPLANPRDELDAKPASCAGHPHSPDVG